MWILPLASPWADMSQAGLQDGDIAYVNGSFTEGAAPAIRSLTTMPTAFGPPPARPGVVEYKFTINGWTAGRRPRGRSV